MKQYLQYQKALMSLALALLDSMEQIKDVFGTVDPEYTKSEIAKLEIRYATTMTELVKHNCQITGFTIVAVDNQENVVSIAEQKYSAVS